MIELSNDKGERILFTHPRLARGVGPIVQHRFTDSRRCAASVHRPPVDLSLEESPEEKRKAAAKTRRILLVDDNVDAVQSLARLLDVLGYEPLVTTSGAAALEQGPQFRPDVVLLDLGMPGMDGFETAVRLRREAWGAGAVLIALTGWGQPEDMRRTREAGFAAHLVKPLDLDALLDLLSRK